MRVAAVRALAGGVTTIHDLGDRNYVSLTLRDWFRTTAEVGATILTSGPPITITGGHCWFLGGEADGEDGIREAVRAHAARGVDLSTVHGHPSQRCGPAQAAAAGASARIVCGTTPASDRTSRTTSSATESVLCPPSE